MSTPAPGWLRAALNGPEKIASQCSFNPDNLREYQLTLYVSCLGALKYGNLDDRAKYRLYLTAAYLSPLIG